MTTEEIRKNALEGLTEDEKQALKLFYGKLDVDYGSQTVFSEFYDQQQGKTAEEIKQNLAALEPDLQELIKVGCVKSIDTLNARLSCEEVNQMLRQSVIYPAQNNLRENLNSMGAQNRYSKAISTYEDFQKIIGIPEVEDNYDFYLKIKNYLPKSPS